MLNRLAVNERTVGAILWLAVGAAVAIESLRLEFGGLRQPGPGFLSLLAAILMLWQAGVLFLSGLHYDPSIEPRRRPINWRPLWPVLVTLSLYVASLPLLGFVAASILFVFFLMLLSDPRRWRYALLISIVTVTLCYFVFVVALEVRLPAGLMKLGMA